MCLLYICTNLLLFLLIVRWKYVCVCRVQVQYPLFFGFCSSLFLFYQTICVANNTITCFFVCFVCAYLDLT